MGQLKVPLAALKVVQPEEISVSMTDVAPMTQAEQDAIEAKYRSAEQPLMVSLDQLQSEPPPPVPVASGMVQQALGAGSMVGGTVGALAGGVPGAAIGGAAGVGYEQLARHAKEIPGAVRDVARNLVSQPAATMQGFKEGALQGAETAGLAGAVNAGMEFGGQKAMGALGGVAKAVYRGYLKPSLAGHAIKDAQTIVNTALEEGLAISKGGTERAQRVIRELKREVDGILQNRQHISQTLHGDIDLHDIANKVRQFARNKYYRVGRPVEDFEAAMKVADSIDAHPSLNLPPGSAPTPQPRNLTDANEVKRTLQQSAGDRAFGVERTAATEAEKHGAYETRQALELRAPKIGPLNARESRLLDAARSIAHAVEREANQNALVGVKSLIAGTAGGVEYGRTGDPWSAAAKALALRYALSPARATKLALLTYRIGKLPGVAPTSAARLGLAVLSEVTGDEQREPE